MRAEQARRLINGAAENEQFEPRPTADCAHAGAHNGLHDPRLDV
jgi:hypothetical protein